MPKLKTQKKKPPKKKPPKKTWGFGQPSPWGGGGGRKCPPGYHWNGVKKKCVKNKKKPPEETEEPQECPEGFHWDEDFQACVQDEGEQECPEGFHWDEDFQACVQDEEDEAPVDEKAQADLLARLTQFLTDNELPETLIDFIKTALAEDKPFSQIVAELRETPEYKAAYPENALRRQKGFDVWSEAEIRAYRAEARRLAQEYVGVDDLTNAEISKMIQNNWSLREWERKLQTYQDFERWGPTVKAILEGELGYSLSDDRVFALLSGDIPTPELDRAYEKALLRGQPALLGLGVRPDEEAELLRRYGISPEQAFRGYQGLVQELPRAERLGAIEAEINRNVGNFPSSTALFADTPFALLFRAIQLGDPDAIFSLQAQMAREVARWQGGGGVAMGGSGAAIGLLTPDERR